MSLILLLAGQDAAAAPNELELLYKPVRTDVADDAASDIAGNRPRMPA